MNVEFKKLDRKYTGYLTLKAEIERHQGVADALGRVSAKSPLVEAHERETIGRIAKLETERAALAGEMAAEFTQIEDPRLQCVLTMRYMEGLRWREIANRMRYSVSHVKRLRNDALKEILKNFKR